MMRLKMEDKIFWERVSISDHMHWSVLAGTLVKQGINEAFIKVERRERSL